MKECPICNKNLALLGLKYMKKFDQYVCNECNHVFLDTHVGLATKSILVGLEGMVDKKQFNILLKRLEKNDK